MIQFRDFAAEITHAGFFTNTFETLDEALDKANAWLEEERVDVVNVETVVLPNIWDSDEEGTGDVDVRASGKSSTTWHQFIRVWYRTN